MQIFYNTTDAAWESRRLLSSRETSFWPTLSSRQAEDLFSQIASCCPLFIGRKP